MANKKSLSFSIEVVEVLAVKIWNNPKCHDCLYEWVEACEMFHIHTRSDDVHCLFCSNNPCAILPISCQYKSWLKELQLKYTKTNTT